MGRADSLVTKVAKDYADSSMFAVAHRDSTLVARLLAEARGPESFPAIASATWEVGWLGRPDVAEPFARRAAARQEQPVLGNVTLGKNLVSQGRWAAADSAFAAASAATVEPRPRIEHAIVASLPFLAVPRPELEAIRAELAGESVGRPSATANDPVDAMLPELRSYALGLLASRLGDAPGALRAAELLDTVQAAPEDRPALRSLAAVVRADVALTSRRPADALNLLQNVRGDVSLDVAHSGPFSEDYGRFLRAEALLALGNDGEALRWLENGFTTTPDELLYGAPVALRLGDVYERRGERQKAADEYTRVLRLWKSCDARLRPALDDARTRLARVTAEPRT